MTHQNRRSLVPVMNDYDGQMIFGDLYFTGEEKPRKKPHQETCPDRGSNPGPLHDRRACYRLPHNGGHSLTWWVLLLLLLLLMILSLSLLLLLLYYHYYNNNNIIIIIIIIIMRCQVGIIFESTAVDQAVACAPLKQRPGFDPRSGQVSWVRFFRGFSSPVRQISGSFRPRWSPNIIWPSLSSILIHYGRQWPEMLTRPKTSDVD